jgi:hypothetical protein
VQEKPGKFRFRSLSEESALRRIFKVQPEPTGESQRQIGLWGSSSRQQFLFGLQPNGVGLIFGLPAPDPKIVGPGGDGFVDQTSGSGMDGPIMVMIFH